MKLFIIVVLIYFSYSIVKAEAYQASVENLQCLKTTDGYGIYNSTVEKFVGDKNMTQFECRVSLTTLEENILCSQKNDGFAVFLTTGKQLGISFSEISQCVETLMSSKGNKICIGLAGNKFSIYDLEVKKYLKGLYPNLYTCKRFL